MPVVVTVSETNLSPEQAAEISSAIKSGNVRVCYAKCWPCITGFHFNPPQPHTWADAEDIEHAKATGREEPTGPCGCPCAHGEHVPDVDDGMVENEHWDVDDAGTVIGDPCPECGEVGACANDREGRPMIHTILAGEDD